MSDPTGQGFADLTIVNSPKNFPQDIDYRILGSGPRESLVRKVIQYACPSSRFKGFSPSVPEDEQAHLLVTDPGWADLLADCTQRQRARVIVMPVPDGDMWSYWEFVKKIVGYIADSDPITIDQALWVRYLKDLGRAQLKGQELVLPRGYYCYTSPKILDENKDRIAFVHDRLSDQLSKENYFRLLRASATEIWENYINRTFSALQYFEYMPARPGDVIINGGVHYGSEIPFFLAHMAGQGELHNIDPLGFDYLSDYAARSIAPFPEVVFEHRLALDGYDGEIFLPLSADGQALGQYANKRIRGFKGSKFPCMTLESFLERQGIEKVDVIKFDLEGAEEVLVPQMAGIIKDSRPTLAISVYHKIEHLWDLPVQLIEMCEDYDFYLNSYSFERFEAIFYCLPRERHAAN
jgi:hypothetical protein